ncbi:MAG: hypothetical protein AAF561_00970 [Planctomycetota bacterium]
MRSSHHDSLNRRRTTPRLIIAASAATALLLPVVAEAAVMVDVPDVVLIADTPNQEVPLFVTGGDTVQGLVLFVSIGDGGPERVDLGLIPGTDAPAITDVDLEMGTIYDDGVFFADLPSIPQFANATAIVTDDSTFVADGQIATLIVDTTGFDSGTFDLRLTNIFPDAPDGPFDSVFEAGGNEVEIIADVGSITVIVPEPTASLLACGVGAFLCRRRRAD